MENFLPDTLTLWITQYGSFSLFVLLALGIFALPIPDETLMLFAGVLIAHGKLSPVATFIAAACGSMAGISISYVIGRTAGVFLIRRYGHWVRITEERMQRVHDWFERVGRWALLIGYFIPGVRHMTGYAAGITSMEYRHFALFSYCGAILWVSMFLSLGYFVGDRWDQIENLFYLHWHQIALVAGVLALVVVGYVQFRKRRKINKK